MATLAGTVCVAFVVDVFSRMFTGWAAARHKRAKLVLDAWTWRCGTVTTAGTGSARG